MNRRVEEERKFEVSGRPVGIPLPNNDYEAGEFSFKRGERLAIFSDGVTDAENTAGQLYEECGLAESHAGIKAVDVEQIGRCFFEELDRFRIGAPAKDDTTYLVIGLD